MRRYFRQIFVYSYLILAYYIYERIKAYPDDINQERKEV